MEENTFGKGLPVRYNQLVTAFRTIKLTAVLLTIFGLHAGARGFSQTITLSERNAPLQRIFTAIQQQTGYGFIYRWENMQLARPVSIQVEKAPLKDVLDICFRDQPLRYSIVDKTIIVSLRTPATKSEQLIDIRGKVVNEKGEAVAGASISIKGSNRLTATNEQGEFIISGVGENAILVVTHISFETVELKIQGRKEISVQLKPNVGELASVAVNTGYQVLKPNEVTGSVAQPDRELYNARVSTDVISKLEGITSGLVFNRTNRGVPSISIRGRSTIFASSDPLIVVDNFPYDGDINNLNPNDIERVDILKDAAAASIWGVRAGNGVIVITTKKGKYNQPLKVEFNTNFTFGEKPDLYYDRGFLNSSNFIDVEIFLFGQGRYTADFTSANKTVISPIVEILQQRKLNQISAADSTSKVDALRSVDVRDEFSKYFYKRSLAQQYAVNFNGGSNNIAYFFSTGYDKNAFSQVGNEQERYTINSSATFNVLKHLELGAGINFSQTNSTYNSNLSEVQPGSRNLYPYARFTDEYGMHLPIVKDFRAVYADTAGGGRLLNWRYYPLDELKLRDYTSKLHDLRTLATLKYRILKGLSAEIKYQYQKSFTQGRQVSNVETYSARDLINRFTRIQPNGTVKYNIPMGGILNLTNATLISNAVRGQLTYNGSWHNNRISVLAGAEAREVSSDSYNNTYYGYNEDILTFGTVNYDSIYAVIPSGSSRVPTPGSLRHLVDRFRSFFLNTAYVLLDRYTLSASARVDQSNLFGVNTNQKSVPLWSVGGKWQINKEKFYELNWLPQLQLRVTYGYNGNLNKTISAYVIARTQAAIPAPIAIITSPGNPDLRWEKTGMANIGLDFGLKNEILSGSIEYFKKKGKDIIGDAPVPSSTGYANLRGNFSDMEGSGFDFQLQSRLSNREVRWSVALLLSTATDKVTRYTGTNVGGGGPAIKVGNPVSSIYSLPWAGLDPSNGDPMGILADTITKNYQALNAIQQADRVNNGPANPIVYGGLRNTISRNGISLSFNFSFKAGYYFRRNTISYSSLFSSWIGHVDYTQRWQKPGDEAFTTVPSMVYPAVSSRETFYANSEATIEKGDHIRLQDISLTYDLPEKFLRANRIRQLQTYLYINNLGIVWRANKNNIDPDYQIGYPTPRTLSFGIRAAF